VNRQNDSAQDASGASGLIGWLLELLGMSGHTKGPATANVATGRTDPLESDRRPAPATRPNLAAATPVATGATNPAAGGRAARPARQPVPELPAPDLPVKPAPHGADVPAQPVLPPKRIEPAPSELLLPQDGPGRSKPGLLEQWSAARQEAKQRSGGSAGSANQSSTESARPATDGTSRQATSESSSQTSGESASPTSGDSPSDSARQAASGSSLRASSGVKSSSARTDSAGAAAGTPAEVATTAGGGPSGLLGALVTLTSSAVSALAGPAAGQHTHDLLSGVVHQVESALATGAPRETSGQAAGDGGQDRARGTQGERANSSDSRPQKTTR
jgi:hypothetical protein